VARAAGFVAWYAPPLWFDQAYLSLVWRIFMEVQDKQIYLASASPRRQQLLQQIGISFEVLPADIDESPIVGESARQFVQGLALAKARHVKEQVGPAASVLGADTIVVIDGQILGKPDGREDAFSMWERLSDTTHTVMTAVALVSARSEQLILNCNQVTFRAISKQEMQCYWDSGEPEGKAGAYAIQGLGAIFVRHLSGSFSGVMGLPLFETSQLLGEQGIESKYMQHTGQSR
jgi:septum formation protein